MFGCDFENYKEEDEVEEVFVVVKGLKDDLFKFNVKKGKVVVKIVKVKYQFQIFNFVGILLEEIYYFVDFQYWFQFFLLECKKDFINFGVCIDWRCQFVMIDVNFYYDVFVRW